MSFGYGRISNFRPEEGQRIELRKARCDRPFFEDARAPEQKLLNEVINRLAGSAFSSRFSDQHMLVVCSLDRLAPSLTKLFTIIEVLHDNGIQLLSLEEKWTVMDRRDGPVLRVHDLISFSRNIAAEKSRLALEAADEKGRLTGRPRKLDAISLNKIAKQLRSGSNVATLATEYGVSVPTLYRNLARRTHQRKT